MPFPSRLLAAGPLRALIWRPSTLGFSGDYARISQCIIDTAVSCCVADGSESCCDGNTTNYFNWRPGCIKAVLNGNGTNRLGPYVSADGTSSGTTTSSAAVASSTSTATCESSGHSEKQTSSKGQTVAMVTSIRPFFYVDDDFLDEVQTRKSAANARTTDAGTGTSIAGQTGPLPADGAVRSRAH
ncbi:uncharacterized protein IWZ02DRAFT_178375 [Phyllosticta citriasiana]|uniref:Uncharacterized protein n=1 Tax=Phyllosticta citriasiana TaxID=595635 RepID=A0ABR1KJL7_9PEZI